jgi:hypothetical protein
MKRSMHPAVARALSADMTPRAYAAAGASGVAMLLLALMITALQG